MRIDTQVSDWLLAGDPAIRWQVLHDLLDASPDSVSIERSRLEKEGWAAELLARQDPDGRWGGGLYTPKWTSTTYTLLLLRQLGLPPGNPQAINACRLLIERGLYRDGGINFFASLKHSETCVTGMVLSILAYFELPDERLRILVEHLLGQQLADGGWNCQSYRGSTHGSFHTTISVLEGLHIFGLAHPSSRPEITISQARGREFLLGHRLYKSHRTGKVVDQAMTRFSFPPRWRYDVLRGLDYFQACSAPYDPRLEDAMQLLQNRGQSDGRWRLQNRHPGRTFFELEQVGDSSRWNTLRALRVLRWWEQVSQSGSSS